MISHLISALFLDEMFALNAARTRAFQSDVIRAWAWSVCCGKVQKHGWRDVFGIYLQLVRSCCDVADAAEAGGSSPFGALEQARQTIDSLYRHPAP